MLRSALGFSLSLLVVLIIVSDLSGLIPNAVFGAMMYMILLLGFRVIRPVIAIQSVFIGAVGFVLMVAYDQVSTVRAFSAIAENASIVGLICGVYALRLLARPTENGVNVFQIKPTPANLLLVAHALGTYTA